MPHLKNPVNYNILYVKYRKNKQETTSFPIEKRLNPHHNKSFRSQSNRLCNHTCMNLPDLYSLPSLRRAGYYYVQHTHRYLKQNINFFINI